MPAPSRSENSNVQCSRIWMTQSGRHSNVFREVS